MLLHVLHHLNQRRAGEKDLVNTAALHRLRVFVSDRAPAAAKYGNIFGALFIQLSDYFREKLDVPAVVTRNSDCSDIFLDRSPNDVADVAVKSQVNDFDSVTNELEINRVNRAVVTIADRNGGKNSNRRGHGEKL